MILITDSFRKLLSKIKSINIDDITLEISKHNKGLDNLIDIGTIKNRTVLKGYLLSKKVRVVILYKKQNSNYLPFYVVKKETKNGFNISKNSLTELNKKLDNIFDDLEKGKYEIINI